MLRGGAVGVEIKSVHQTKFTWRKPLEHPSPERTCPDVPYCHVRCVMSCIPASCNNQHASFSDCDCFPCNPQLTRGLDNLAWSLKGPASWLSDMLAWNKRYPPCTFRIPALSEQSHRLLAMFRRSMMLYGDRLSWIGSAFQLGTCPIEPGGVSASLHRNALTGWLLRGFIVYINNSS